MNILEIINTHIGERWKPGRREIIKRSQVKESSVSRFLNQRGGLDAFAFTRLVLALGFKIYDKNGNIVLGHKGKTDEQIAQNFPPYQIAEMQKAPEETINDNLQNDNTQTQ